MPTAAQFQGLVIASLSAADPTAQIDLQSKVPLYWSMYVLKARWPDIRFWYTYREACLLIMGRTRRQIDQVRRNSRATGDSQVTSTSDGNSVSGASTDSTETGRSTLTRGSNRTLNGATSGIGSSNMTSRRLLTTGQRRDDTGSGSGSESSYLIKNTDSTRQHYSLSDGPQVGPPQKGISHGELSRKENSTLNEVDSSFETDDFSATTRLIEADTLHTHNHTYLNTSDRVVQGGVDGLNKSGTHSINNAAMTAQGHAESARSFNAVVDESSFATADPNINRMDGSSSLVEHSSDIGSYHATSALTSRTDTAHSGSGSTVTRDSTVGARESLAMGEAHFQMQKLQQQFLHLNDLWKEASVRIKTLEQQAVITERHQLVQAVTTNVDDYSTSPFAILGVMPMIGFPCPSLFNP